MAKAHKQPAQIIRVAVPSGTEEEQAEATEAAQAAASGVEVHETEQEEQEPKSELDQLLSEFPDANKCNIYRIANNGIREYVGVGEPRVVCDMEYLRSNYGPGKYNLLIYTDGKFTKNKTLVIGTGIVPPAVAPGVLPGSAIPTSIESILREQIVQLNTLVMSILTKQPQSAQGEKISDIVAAVAAVQQMTQPAAPAPNPLAGMETMLTIVQKLMDMAGPPAPVDEKTSWVHFAKEALGALPVVLDRVKGVVTAGSGAPSIDSREVPVVTEADRAKQLLKQGIGFLKPKILKGEDHEFWVEYVVRQIDDPSWKTIALEICNTPWEQLEVLDSDLTREPYAQWFKAFVAGVKHELLDKDNAAGSGSDDSDPSGNGSVDKKRVVVS